MPSFFSLLMAKAAEQLTRFVVDQPDGGAVGRGQLPLQCLGGRFETISIGMIGAMGLSSSASLAWRAPAESFLSARMRLAWASKSCVRPFYCSRSLAYCCISRSLLGAHWQDNAQLSPADLRSPDYQGEEEIRRRRDAAIDHHVGVGRHLIHRGENGHSRAAPPAPG